MEWPLQNTQQEKTTIWFSLRDPPKRLIPKTRGPVIPDISHQQAYLSDSLSRNRFAVRYANANSAQCHEQTSLATLPQHEPSTCRSWPQLILSESASTFRVAWFIHLTRGTSSSYSVFTPKFSFAHKEGGSSCACLFISSSLPQPLHLQ